MGCSKSKGAESHEPTTRPGARSGEPSTGSAVRTGSPEHMTSPPKETDIAVWPSTSYEEFEQKNPPSAAAQAVRPVATGGFLEPHLKKQKQKAANGQGEKVEKEHVTKGKREVRNTKTKHLIVGEQWLVENEQFELFPDHTSKQNYNVQYIENKVRIA